MAHVTERLTDDLPPRAEGKPHAKACAVCAFRRGNPQGLDDEEFASIDFQSWLGDYEFLCVHRPDANGHVLPCASWSAMQRTRERLDGRTASP